MHNHEDHHDEHKGRILSRREALATIGGGALAFLAARTMRGATAATPPARPLLAATSSANNTCIARPELTEGPYFVDEKLVRSDIRSDAKTGAIKVGVPLELTFNVSQISSAGCAALKGALVDVWHTDAQGLYSDIGNDGTAGQTFLRGSQTTDAQGIVHFTTIYPGWYRGRTVHIHFKIRAANPSGGTYEFTSQLFFNDDVSDAVFAQAAYKRNARRDQTNARDGIFREGGDGLLLDLKPSGDGFKASFDIGLDLSQPSRGRGGGPGGPPGFDGPPDFGGPDGGPGGPPPDRGGFGHWGDD